MRLRPLVATCWGLLLAFGGAEACLAVGQSVPAIQGLPFEIGRLEADAAPGGHPRLFFTAAEVERGRRRTAEDGGGRDVLLRFLAMADPKLEAEIKPLDEGWWGEAATKPWEATYPEVYVHTCIEPTNYAHGAATLATAWLLTGQERYAERATAMLMNLAGYSFRAEHYDVGMNYAGWGIHALKAYDVLFDRLGSGQRAALDAMMARLAWAVARNDVYWIDNGIGGGLNNHLAWHKAMLGLLGLFYGRPEMVEYCLHGRRGMVSLLEEGLLDNGLWCESSLIYQFAAVDPMLVFGNCQRRVGFQPSILEIVGANGRTLKQAYDAMFDVLAADGLIPPIGDAYGRRVRLWEASSYEVAWAAWGDPKHAWLLRHNDRRGIDAVFAPALPADVPAPAIRSLLRPEHGYAFLRSSEGASYWDSDARCAFLTYDRSGVHSNADKLSLMLFGRKRLLIPDVEGISTTPHAFSSEIQRQLNRGGLSQNTVMIDGQDQRGTGRLLRLVEFRDLRDEKRVSACDDEGLLYEGVRQMRTVAMAADYVLDVFQVDCGGRERQIDWVVHAMDEGAKAPDELDPELKKRCRPFALPKAGAWRWLRNGRAFVPSGAIELRWGNGEVLLQLHMGSAGVQDVILLDYPASDRPDSGRIPTVIVRTQGRRMVFAAVWIVSDLPRSAKLGLLPPREASLVYEVTVDGAARQHLVPRLVDR
ncbi:MAG TPA: alginate lyase family protein [Phycisphaerae bacterium]|nr:alginate lyase family protein [Phycisphaerae bacterium]HRY68148.1 alginate lyase family protein [Phycisphaerae bacterium]HSA27044.1 alginate lyase family protein [Phycisphaerae bacterium]